MIKESLIFVSENYTAFMTSCVWVFAILYVWIILEIQIKYFYYTHDPTGEILKYGIIDRIKIIFCATLTPLGIILVIRNVMHAYQVKKIKKERRF